MLSIVNFGQVVWNTRSSTLDPRREQNIFRLEMKLAHDRLLAKHLLKFMENTSVVYKRQLRHRTARINFSFKTLYAQANLKYLLHPHSVLSPLSVDDS